MKKFTLLLLTVLFLTACINQKEPIFKEIIIGEEIFGDYPAVLLNLRTGETIKISNNFTKEAGEIDADLWIEPGDPEIACLEDGFEDKEHKGEDTKLKVIGDSFGNISLNSVKNIQLTDNDISRDDIIEGVVFVVQASDKSLYKVQADFFPFDEEIKIKYEKL